LAGISSDAYEDLRKLVDSHISGCPPAPEIDEILRILFTPEEAAVSLGLGFKPAAAEEIASRTGTDLEAARNHLEALADKGLVFARDKEGQRGYAILPVMPGLFEFPFMKGVRNEEIDRLAKLWQGYFPVLARGFGAPGTSFSRIIPIQEEIDSQPGVLTYEKAYELIDKAKATGIAHCACRESEQACDAPTEACMLFDETCNFLVERGFARYLSKDEMKEKLREFDEAGLVHQVNNSQDRLTFVCNCCPCCCGLLRTLTEFGNANVLTASAYVPGVDADLCTGCATCADERCPMDAVDIVDAVAVFDDNRCIGCGLCVTGCPNQALTLERRREVPVPPETRAEMAVRILTSRDKLDDFMKLMNR